MLGRDHRLEVDGPAGARPLRGGAPLLRARALLPRISPRTLSERLRWLEEEGVVDRRSYAETPPRVEYQLTPKGLALLPVIEAMRQFGHDWLVQDPDHTHD